MAPSTVTIEIAPGELVDKITILEIKLDRIKDPGKVKNIRAEHDTLTGARDDAVSPSPELDLLTSELKAVNAKLWQIEDDIRDCERSKDFGQTFIDLARAVYFSNDERSIIKRRINELLGSPLIEEKSYAAY